MSLCMIFAFSWQYSIALINYLKYFLQRSSVSIDDYYVFATILYSSVPFLMNSVTRNNLSWVGSSIVSYNLTIFG